MGGHACFANGVRNREQPADISCGKWPILVARRSYECSANVRGWSWQSAFGQRWLRGRACSPRADAECQRSCNVVARARTESGGLVDINLGGAGAKPGGAPKPQAPTASSPKPAPSGDIDIGNPFA